MAWLHGGTCPAQIETTVTVSASSNPACDMSTSIVHQSLFARRFNIPSIADDIQKWDEAWERVLPRLSSSEDVFPVLKQWWSLRAGPRRPSALADLAMRIRGQVVRSQDLTRKLLAELDQRKFMFVMLLRDEEVKRHLLNGMKEACAHVSLRGDARALCPDITISMMMGAGTGEGLPIFDKFSTLFCGFVEHAVAPGYLVLLRSDWWNSAVPIPHPWPADVEFVFELLTVQRNEFITGFVLHTLLSVVREANFVSPIANLLKPEGFFSTLARSNTSLVLPETTPIRCCAYCTGSSEELGGNVKFMACTKCRSKAKTDVYYCSRTCQAAHWNKHKSQCGKVVSPRRTQDYTWSYDFFEPDRELEGWPFISSTNVTGSPKAANPERTLSPALRRQIAVLRLHPDADYILFDDQDRPVPFTMSVSDRPMKILFEQLLVGCMFGPNLDGLNVIAEYIVVAIARKPGLSVARILAQLSSEFEADITKMMVEIQSKKIEQGLDPGKTFLEEMTKGLVKVTLSERVKC